MVIFSELHYKMEEYYEQCCRICVYWLTRGRTDLATHFSLERATSEATASNQMFIGIQDRINVQTIFYFPSLPGGWHQDMLCALPRLDLPRLGHERLNEGLHRRQLLVCLSSSIDHAGWHFGPPRAFWQQTPMCWCGTEAWRSRL